MAEHLNHHPSIWPAYRNTRFAHWPHCLRLMAITAHAMWRANRPDAIAILVALNTLRHTPSVTRVGEGAQYTD